MRSLVDASQRRDERRSRFRMLPTPVSLARIFLPYAPPICLSAVAATLVTHRTVMQSILSIVSSVKIAAPPRSRAHFCANRIARMMLQRPDHDVMTGLNCSRVIYARAGGRAA
jgi:hypothetical protein